MVRSFVNGLLSLVNLQLIKPSRTPAAAARPRRSPYALAKRCINGLLSRIDLRIARVPPVSPYESVRTVHQVARIASRGREAFPIDREHMMCRVLGRYWMIFRMGDGLVTDRLMAEGFWEKNITLRIIRDLKPGMRAIDVGANVGYFSLLMADLVGDEGHLHVVEPTPSLGACLARSLCLNYFDHRFSLVTSPLTEADDREVMFFIPRGDTKNARITERSPAETGDGEGVILKTRKLDSIIAPGARIDLIKVDVEGAELRVWNGMQRVVWENPGIAIILEFNARRPYDPHELLESIEREGFPLAFIDDLGDIRPTSRQQLLDEKVGEDWMLYLRRPEQSRS
jgi:FkbM family methyltransferase